MRFTDNVKSTCKNLLHPHYLTNIILATSYFLLKNIPYVCDTVFEACILEWREYEILMLLLVFVGVKCRKAATLLQLISSMCTYSKAANIILYWREGPVYVLIYSLAWFLHFVFLPQPIYKGPEKIQYYRGMHLINDIKSDARITWLVCFYAPWSPPCIDLASVFAELSNKYGDLKNFRFAKIDINQFQEVGKYYGISTSSMSKQLPTLILFKDGAEVKRRPFADSKGTVYPFLFSLDNIIKEFDINSVYYECKKNPVVVKPLSKQSEEKKKTN